MMQVDPPSWIQYLRRDGEAEMKEKVRSLLFRWGGGSMSCGHRGVLDGSQLEKGSRRLDGFERGFAVLADV